jgi:hypothetical protein
MIPPLHGFYFHDPRTEIENRLYLLERSVREIESRLELSEEINPKRRYSLKEAASLLGFSERTLQRRAKTGQLHIMKDGKMSFMTGAEILRYARETE